MNVQADLLHVERSLMGQAEKAILAGLQELVEVMTEAVQMVSHLKEFVAHGIVGVEGFDLQILLVDPLLEAQQGLL